MHNRTNLRRRRVATAAALAVATALSLVGCAASSPSDSSTSGTGEKVTLTLSTYGNFGYTDKLLAEFEAKYPNITIKPSVAASGSDVRTRIITGLAAGTGLSDVEAVEVSWMAELAKYTDKWVTLPSDDKGGPFIDSQALPAKNSKGDTWAYGVGIGPTAICYRADLFKAAGLPTEPADVAKLLTGDWANYYKVGQQYLAAGGTGKWFDSAAATFYAQVNQIQYAYEDSNGNVIAATNPDVRKLYDAVLAQSNLSAKIAQWGNDWYAGMANGAWATMSCPSWMLSIISGAAPKLTDWRVADVYPDGGGNWGGSWLAVPTQSKHPKEATLLAQWLSSPEIQTRLFPDNGTFPSRKLAYDDPALKAATNDFFGGQKVGEIFTNRANAITTTHFQGPKDQLIQTAIAGAITRAETGAQTPDQAWAQFQDELKTIAAK